MFRGPATINVYADDVAAARAWYTEIFAVEPYFVREAGGVTAYVEFRIGDRETELGIIDRRFEPRPGSVGGAIVHWHVDDLDATLADLLERGATMYDPRRERGEDFVTASVVDPFGNVLGVMHNPHYRQMFGLDSEASA